MAFPITHVVVAWHMLQQPTLAGRYTAAQQGEFLLGAWAPDGIHYRRGFDGAAMQHIGPAKKITHLCPVSPQPWGQVTDNTGWVACVGAFLAAHPDNALAAGYATHVLTDIYNNMTLWDDFRTTHPAEAAKGYQSEYYQDLRRIDLRLFHTYIETPPSPLLALLEAATAQDFPGLVTAEEVHALRHNVLHISYPHRPPEDTAQNTYSTWDDMQQFIHGAATFAAKELYQLG